MPVVKKVARHLRYAREVKAIKRRLVLRVAVESSLAVAPHLIERVGDEEESWTNRQSAPAAVHWGEEFWDSESENMENEEEWSLPMERTRSLSLMRMPFSGSE
jgi:hypothetical protein